MDVIAATAFGIKLDTQTTPDDPFIKNARKFFDANIFSPAFIILCKCLTECPYLAVGSLNNYNNVIMGNDLISYRGARGLGGKFRHMTHELSDISPCVE